MNLKEQINQEIENLMKQSGLLKDENIMETLEKPPNPGMGDVASNVAFSLTKRLKKSPMEIADEVINSIELPGNLLVEKMVNNSGYINFFLNYKKIAGKLLENIVKNGENFGSSKIGEGKKYMIEFAHPNTHKLFHIGHLRNICIGESLVRILQFNGFEVIRSNYQGDVGLHIAKCLYGIMETENYEEVMEKLLTIDEKMAFLGKCYVKGSNAYKDDENAKEMIRDINYLIYAAAQKFNQEERNIEPSSTDYMKFVHGKGVQLEKVHKLWKETRGWSLEYFERIYKRLYSHYDRYYFESECLAGVDIAKEAKNKGILVESEGAIIFDGEPFGLDKRVFINHLGLPTYEGKELKLSQLEFSEFGKLDKCIHVVAPEQTSFFSVTFKVEELLDPEKFKDKQYHLAYGWVKLKEGKMSSRTGNIVLAEDIINEAKLKLEKYFGEERDYLKNEIEDISEKVGISAVKYSMLKIGVTKEISFDLDESVSFEGDSGPYLQYSHVRAKKILEKAGDFQETFQVSEVAKEEEGLVKKLLEFPDVVKRAGVGYKPNLIANYAYEIAEAFSSFYHSCPVLKSEDEQTKNFRLTLTKAFKITIKNCLNLLGIETPEKM